MKKPILVSLLTCVPVVAYADSPVVSGYGLEPYHGYVGIGYDSNIITLDGYTTGHLPGLAVTFGHNYTPWLDLEFRASTAMESLESRNAGANNIKLKYDYNLTGLLKFKWRATRVLDLNLLTGVNYLVTHKTKAGVVTDGYNSGLVLGAGLGINLTQKVSINADYLTYQRSGFMGSSSDTWDVANITLQYHY